MSWYKLNEFEQGRVSNYDIPSHGAWKSTSGYKEQLFPFKHNPKSLLAFQASSCASSRARSSPTASLTPPSSCSRATATTSTASTPPPSAKYRLVGSFPKRGFSRGVRQLAGSKVASSGLSLSKWLFSSIHKYFLNIKWSVLVLKNLVPNSTQWPTLPPVSSRAPRFSHVLLTVLHATYLRQLASNWLWLDALWLPSPLKI